MPEQTPQNFENHIRNDKVIVTVAIMYVVALIVTVVGIFTAPFVIALGVLITAIAGLGTAAMARGYSTKVQDRIVRLEMRLRLKELLDENTQSRIPDLTLSQLIGLRFASDEELPGLTRKVLDENITKASEVKKLVTDWQPDYHRV